MIEYAELEPCDTCVGRKTHPNKLVMCIFEKDLELAWRLDLGGLGSLGGLGGFGEWVASGVLEDQVAQVTWVAKK